MTRTVFDRRRAERFAQLIAEDGGARRHHLRSDIDAELSPLVDITRRVSAIPVSAEPDPEFRVGLRAMLTARIERDGIGATAVQPRGVPPIIAAQPAPPTRTAGTRRGRARIAIFAGVTAGALALSGVSAASGDAMPGDPLYKVKRSTERAQLALASSDVTRGQLYLQFAQVRLAEARRTAPDYLHDILLDMNVETRQGMKLLATAAIDRRDGAALDTIDAFVGTQRRPLLALADGVSDRSRNDVLEALTILDSVAARAQSLRGAVRCGGSAGIDELGPRPRPCVAGSTTDGQPRTVTRPEVVASGTQGGATAPVPSPASAATTSAVPASTSASASAVEQVEQQGTRDKGNKKDRDDSLLDKLGNLLGSLLGN